MDGLKSTPTRRWLARLSFVLAGLAAAYFFLSRRGIWRWLSLAVFRGARLRAQADSTTIEAPQALLVSNNPYGTGDIAGLGRRTRLDRGILGAVGVINRR